MERYMITLKGFLRNVGKPKGNMATWYAIEKA
jgi:hypothetical protein